MSFKTVAISSLLALLVLLLGLSLFFGQMPYFAQTVVEKEFGDLLKKWDLKFKLDDMGLSRTLVSQLQLGPDLSADLAVLNYKIKGVSRPDPLSVIITGFHATAALDASTGLTVRGLLPSENKGEAKAEIPEKYLAVLPKHVIFKNSVIMLLVKNRFVRLPFEMTLNLNRTAAVLNCRARIFPFGQAVDVEAVLDRKGHVDVFRLSAPSFNLALLAPFLPPKVLPALSHTTDLVVEKVSPNQYEFIFSQLRPFGSSGPVLRRINAKALLEKQQVSIVGECRMTRNGMPDIPLFAKLIVRKKDKDNKNARFDLSVENHALDELPMEFGTVAVTLNRPLMRGRVKGTLNAFEGKWSLKCTGVKSRKAELTWGAKQIELLSDFSGGTDAGTLSTLQHITSRLKDIRIETGHTLLRFKQLDTKGNIRLDPSTGPVADLVADLVQGSLDMPARRLSVKGIRARLPLTYPDIKGAGRFSAAAIVYDNRYRFSTEGRIRRTGYREAAFDGSIRMAQTDGIGAAFKGTAGIRGTPFFRFELGSDQFRFSSVDFEDLAPGLWAAEYEFDLSAMASAVLENRTLSTAGTLTVHKGDLSLPDLNLTLKGIKGNLSLADLLKPESVPGQTLTIDAVSLDRFRFQNASVRFSLEDGQFLLVENVRFNWCNGLVSTESVRIPSPGGQTALTLYCDRLELTRLLEQVGEFKAEGKGTLNGRIPVLISNGEITFDNGFLFSTPGVGGRVNINNTEKLLSGIPGNSPQFMQLDLAREALKDFQYQWAKLRLNTKKDTLTVNMELDGKPSHLLPFEYNKEMGGFIRVDAQSPGSRFQGIKLDVNLKLPFNQVLKFGNKMKNIME